MRYVITSYGLVPTKNAIAVGAGSQILNLTSNGRLVVAESQSSTSETVFIELVPMGAGVVPGFDYLGSTVIDEQVFYGFVYYPERIRVYGPDFVHPQDLPEGFTAR